MKTAIWIGTNAAVTRGGRPGDTEERLPGGGYRLVLDVRPVTAPAEATTQEV